MDSKIDCQLLLSERPVPLSHKNPYEKTKMQEMPYDALFYAQRLMQMDKQSQNFFDSDEAEVYKQGGQLVIWSKAI